MLGAVTLGIPPADALLPDSSVSAEGRVLQSQLPETTTPKLTPILGKAQVRSPFPTWSCVALQLPVVTYQTMPESFTGPIQSTQTWLSVLGFESGACAL